MPSEVSIEVSDLTWLYDSFALLLDHVPATLPLNMKIAKQQRAAIRKRGIRKTQPHHCFTGLSSSSSLV
jgi:hypothetical protein